MNLAEILLPFTLNALKKSNSKRPIMIGISGCQGCGKTTLCAQLQNELRKLGMTSVFLSMDDLYLTFQNQQELFRKTKNPLLEWRGLPGTHDIDLGKQILSSLKSIKGEGRQKVTKIPRYDKSQNQGRGDRLSPDEWDTVPEKIDVILFEGWSLGFKSLTAKKLHEMSSRNLIGWNCSMANLDEINENLLIYEKEWYNFLDFFVQIKPLDIKYVFDWRLEQEESLRRQRGAQAGLEKDQVFEFVNRFMPAYTLYLDRLSTVGFFEDGSGRFLQVVIDFHRNVVSSKEL